MIKQTVTFENLDGEMVTRDYYFHISKRELTLMAATGELEKIRGDLEQLIKISEIEATLEGDAKMKARAQIVEGFFNFLRLSVGVRSGEDAFIKTDDYAEQFVNSDASWALLEELMRDAGRIEAFVNGMFPNNVQKMIEEVGNQPQLPLNGESKPVEDVQLPVANIPAQAVSPENTPVVHDPKNIEDYSRMDLLTMPDEQFDALVDSSKNGKNIPKHVLSIMMQRADYQENQKKADA